MENLFSEIDKCLQKGQRTVLARIIRQVGSAPRTTGTKCLILEDGTLKGTIGGGRLEYQVLEKAKETFKKGLSCILPMRLTGKEVAQTEMLCGGVVDVYLEPIYPENKVAKDIYHEIAALTAEGGTGVLLTQILEGTPYRHSACRALLKEDGTAFGTLETDPKAGNQELLKFLKTRRTILKESESGGTPLFVEPIKPEDILYLFGAGHISTYVAPLAKMARFKLVVIDDREEFAHKKRFPFADEIIVAPVTDAFDRIDITASSYVAIVTRGHIHDRDVLRKALANPGGYIGMIGSRRKRDIIYKSLMEEGVTTDQLNRVHCPIGLNIGGETPEEIAISIVAELIQTRTSQQNQPVEE